MKWIDPNIFTNDGITNAIESLIKKQETLNYNYSNLQTQLNNLKKNNFKNLYIYEQKKQFDKTIIPNREVLTELKLLETDTTYKNMKQNLESLKGELKSVDKEIKHYYDSLNNMFSFKPYNLKRYLKLTKEYFTNKTMSNFEAIMTDIFNNEFNNKQLYFIVNLQRNYKVFDILIEKAPDEMKQLFKIVRDEQMKINNYYEKWYIKFHKCDIQYFIAHLLSKLHDLEVK